MSFLHPKVWVSALLHIQVTRDTRRACHTLALPLGMLMESVQDGALSSALFKSSQVMWM